MRLGRLPVNPEHQRKLLRFAKYATALPTPPPSRDWLAAVTNPGMMLNDTEGDCTCAALGHLIQIWTASNGQQVTVSDDAVQQVYVGACGYVIGDSSTDNGGVETSVLNYARTTGIGGYKIDAYVALDQSNELHIKQAIDIFGAVYIGLALPLTAQTQDVWRVALGGGEGSKAGSWGGHAVVVGAYDDAGLTCITWGAPKRLSWDFWDSYCDESYAPLGSLWVKNGQAPSGFDDATLQADLQAVAA